MTTGENAEEWEYDSDASESTNMANLRAYAKRQSKAATDAKKELDGLKTRLGELESTARERTIEDTFVKVGLDKKYLKLFAKVNEGDVTEEAVKAFKDEYGFSTTVLTQEAEGEGEGETETEGASEDEGFTPEPAGSGSAPGKSYKSEDLWKLAESGDTAALERAAAEIVRNPSKLKLANPDLVE